MFYKKGFLNKEEINLYENEGSLEFAIAMKEHLKNKKIENKAISAKENKNNSNERKLIKYIPVFEDRFCITVTGYYSINNSFYLILNPCKVLSFQILKHNGERSLVYKILVF